MERNGGATETVTIGIATEATGTVATTVTETEIAMGTGIATATETAIATAVVVTATVVTEKEAGGIEMIVGVTGMGETRGAGRGGTEEMIALLSLNHQNAGRAGGTTKGKVNTSLYQLSVA